MNSLEVTAMNSPAIIQTAVLILGIARVPRYWAFLSSLAASLPFLWLRPQDLHPVRIDWFTTHSGHSWEHNLWLPCALSLVPLQAIAALEACFAFGERYFLAPSVIASLSRFAIASSMAFWVWPVGDAVGQVVQAARYQRVGTCVILLLSCGWYASHVPVRDFGSTEGMHLLLLAAWSVTWMVPIISPIPREWAEWMRIDWMTTMRCAVLVLWVGLVAGRRNPNVL